MLYDPKTKSGFCFGCQKWYKIERKFMKCWDLDGMLVCDAYDFHRSHQPEHIIGYIKDLPEIFGEEEKD